MSSQGQTCVCEGVRRYRTRVPTHVRCNEEMVSSTFHLNPQHLLELRHLKCLCRLFESSRVASHSVPVGETVNHGPAEASASMM